MTISDAGKLPSDSHDQQLSDTEELAFEPAYIGKYHCGDRLWNTMVGCESQRMALRGEYATLHFNQSKCQVPVNFHLEMWNSLRLYWPGESGWDLPSEKNLRQEKKKCLLYALAPIIKKCLLMLLYFSWRECSQVYNYITGSIKQVFRDLGTTNIYFSLPLIQICFLWLLVLSGILCNPLAEPSVVV